MNARALIGAAVIAHGDPDGPRSVLVTDAFELDVVDATILKGVLIGEPSRLAGPSDLVLAPDHVEPAFRDALTDAFVELDNEVLLLVETPPPVVARLSAAGRAAVHARLALRAAGLAPSETSSDEFVRDERCAARALSNEASEFLHDLTLDLPRSGCSTTPDWLAASGITLDEVEPERSGEGVSGSPSAARSLFAGAIAELEEPGGPCELPDEEHLIGLFRRTLPTDQALRVASHLHSCRSCGRRYEVVVEEGRAMDACESAAPHEPGTDELDEAGVGTPANRAVEPSDGSEIAEGRGRVPMIAGLVVILACISAIAGFVVSRTHDVADLAAAIVVSPGGGSVEGPDGVRRPIHPWQVLSKGEIVLPGPYGPEIFVAATGRRVAVRNRPYIVPPVGNDPRVARAMALLEATAAALERPAIAAVGPERPLAIYPRSRRLDGRPSFAFDVADVFLRVCRSDGLPVVVVDERVSGDRWSYPTDKPSLEPGAYDYFVRRASEGPIDLAADGESRARLEASFVVLDDAERTRIDAERRALESTLPPDDDVLRGLVRACFFAKDGIYLLDDARRELLAVLEREPGHPAAARLLERVEVKLGLGRSRLRSAGPETSPIMRAIEDASELEVRAKGPTGEAGSLADVATSDFYCYADMAIEDLDRDGDVFNIGEDSVNGNVAHVGTDHVTVVFRFPVFVVQGGVGDGLAFADLNRDGTANSLIDHPGVPIASAQIGISVVPPELVVDLLPPGLLQHTFDITVQAIGGATFSTPAPMTFPDVIELNFQSFDHTTGRLVIEGTGTVSAYGPPGITPERILFDTLPEATTPPVGRVAGTSYTPTWSMASGDSRYELQSFDNPASWASWVVPRGAGALFSSQPAVADDGTLVWTPAESASQRDTPDVRPTPLLWSAGNGVEAISPGQSACITYTLENRGGSSYSLASRSTWSTGPTSTTYHHRVKAVNRAGVADHWTPPASWLPTATPDLDQTAGAIQSALRPGEAIVEYVYDRHHYLARVFERDRVRAIPLRSSTRIDEDAGAFRAAILSDDPVAFGSMGIALADRIWRPVEAAFAERPSTVYIVAHGPLEGVPFAALPGARGFLVDEAALVYLDDPAEILLRRASAAGNRSLVSVGGVRFGRPTDPRRTALESLPMSGVEADRVSSAFGSRDAAVGLSGGDATESAVCAAIPHAGFVHIATHGVFPESAAPGLALADGVLTAPEIAALDLRGTRLVNLSACDSSGDLARAFRGAGAPAVVASRLPVEDAATSRFMGLFYERLFANGGGHSPAEALRAASIGLRDAPVDVLDPVAGGREGRDVIRPARLYAAPRYWAGFEVRGPWGGAAAAFPR